MSPPLLRTSLIRRFNVVSKLIPKKEDRYLMEFLITSVADVGTFMSVTEVMGL